MKETLLLLSAFYCQVLIAQPDFRYKRVGDDELIFWNEYDSIFHNNGLIDRVIYKQIDENVLSPEKAFYYNIPADSNVVIISERIIYTELYHYNDNWTLNHVEKLGPYDQSKMPVNSRDSEIDLGRDCRNIYITGAAGESAAVFVSVINHSDVSVVLTPVFSDSILFPISDILHASSADTTAFGFGLKLEPGKNNYTVTLQNDSISRSFSFITFGYDISGFQVLEGNTISTARKFIYQPSGNESLLTIYDRKKKKVLLRVPLSRAENLVDLSALKPGEYWIERTFYTTTSSGCRLILIE